MRSHLKPLFIVILCLALVTVSAFAKSPVWKVSKGSDYVFLGGTVHLLSKTDYPLPAAFETAYKNTDHIVLEVNVSAMNAPEVQSQLLNAMSFQDHQGLSTVLDRETYKELDGLLTSRGVPIAVFERFTPAGAMMALTQFELQRLGLIGGDGVDNHFSMRATRDDKPSYYLESFDEQLSFIKSMNQLEPNLVIKSGIQDINNLKSYWADLITAWRIGDMHALEKTGIDRMKREFPKLYQTLIVQRNDDWLAQIERMITTEDKEFILVGALHMAGSDGLVQRLKRAGYDVNQLD